jgi:hypothetical protein
MCACVCREDLALSSLQAQEAAAKASSAAAAVAKKPAESMLMSMGLIGDVSELAATDRIALNSDVPIQLHQPPQTHPKNIGELM